VFLDEIGDWHPGFRRDFSSFCSHVRFSQWEAIRR